MTSIVSWNRDRRKQVHINEQSSFLHKEYSKHQLQQWLPFVSCSQKVGTESKVTGELNARTFNCYHGVILSLLVSGESFKHFV